ncbi:host attachment protein [Caulobacter sp. NIBR1757]|uniref:host attachment protein n=1 Tax=Caulobacter sp. NIBR1757 TaxID=3016000 RepID=UPI0022EFEB2E|nr:host attachment protein [Caulobacter sp. NIBR1757]
MTEHPDWLAGLAVHGESNPEKAEPAFLDRLCHRVDALFDKHGFEHLILIAAPRSLGLLRTRLSAKLKARLVLSEPHDRLAASLDTIEHAVRAMRVASA